MGVVTALLLARARRAGVRRLLVSAAVALATVPLVVGPAVGGTTAAAALRRGVAELPAGERSLAVSSTGIVDDALLTRLDAAARDTLDALGGGPVHRQVLFNELSDRSGASFRLAGADDLAGMTRLVEGRSPAPCRPGRCEVVLLTEAGPPTVAPPDPDPELGLVVVGRVERTDPLLLGGTFDPGDVPVLLAGPGLDTAVPERLAGFGRAYGWVSPWDADRVVALGLDAWLGRATRAGAALSGVTPGVVLTVPDGVLRREAARAELSARRLGLLAAGSCVVLLGAAVVGGSALRRDHEGFAGALRSRGATARTVGALLVGEGLLAAAAGVVAGLAAGAGVAALLASRGGLPVAAATADALVAGLPAAVGLAVVATGLLVAAVALPAPVAGRGAGLLRALEGGAAACLGAAALVVAGDRSSGVGGLPDDAGGAAVGAAGGTVGGAVDASTGSGQVLTALPILLLVATALLVARGWPALARGLLRLPPRHALGARLGLAAAAGRPGRPAATAALVATSVAAAVFAAGYAGTLDRGAAEQAAYAVPLDARLLPGPGLSAPSDAVAPDRLAAALPGATVSGVVRTAGSVLIGPQQADVVQLVGIDPQVLPRIARWSAVTGSTTDPADLARRLAGPPPPTPRTLPAGRQLRLETRGEPVRVAVTAHVRAADGRERGIPLAVAPPPVPGGPAALVGELPALTDAAGAPAPLDLVALVVRQPSDAADRRLHALDGGAVAGPAGALELGAVSVDGRPVATPWRGWSGGGSATAEVAADGARVELAYRLTSGPAILVPALAPGPVAVAVDPLTAASASAAAGGGAGVTLLVDGVPFEADPVAVLEGFPTTTGRFAVLDARVLADLVGRTQPGTATPAELWVSAGAGGRAGLVAATSRAPLDRLDVHVRSTTEAALRADPVARAATGLLLAGAVLGLLVALAAVALLVAGERSDDAAVHYAWEADGVPPGTLQAALWWGAVAVVVPGALAGVAAGLGLSALTARLVAVTASATAARPALHAEPGDPWVLAATGASVLLTLAVAGLVAARSMRAPLPVRQGGWFR